MLLSQSINSYFNKNQKAVLLSVVQTAIKSRPRKSIKSFVAYGSYITLCRMLKIRSSDENDFWTELKVIELAGFLKTRVDSIGSIGGNEYSLEEIQDAIYEDPEFSKVLGGYKVVTIKVELDPEHLEYIQKHNINLNEFTQKLIEDLRNKTEAEEIAKLRELMKKYPEIVKEEN